MIDVKGTKSAKPETDESYEHYVLKNQDKRSSVPLFFTIFLTGIALYLKSAFPGSAKALPQEEEPETPQDEAAAPPEVIEIGLPEAAFEMDAVAPEPKKARQTDDDLFDYRDSTQYVLNDSPLIDIQKLPLPSFAFLKKMGGVSVSFKAANDNGWTAGRSAGPGNGSRGTASGHPYPDDDSEGAEGKYDYREGGEDDGAEPDVDGAKATNRAPRTNGPVQLMDVFGCTAALIGLADFLRGASDPDGDKLSIKNITVSSGQITQTADGWLFDPSMLGPVTVTYQITDGQFSIVQIAQFAVLRNPPVVGTIGDDVMLGTECADDIDGRDGNDNIDSRAGSDTVNGGAGNDHIIAGSGNDVVFAGEGDDIVLGGLGNDQIWGGNGNDRLYGEDGQDTIFGDAGDDTISGGNDDDMLFGGAGADIVMGDAGNDRINGGEGNDRLDGGDGNDIVLGEAGLDELDGGTGDDFLSGGDDEDIVNGGGGEDVVAGDADGAADLYDGGSDTDTLDYSATKASTHIDLAAGTAVGAEIGEDTISNFEILRAGVGDDEIAGSDQVDEIHGGDGADQITGAAADDRLFGDEGADQLSGGDGADIVDGGGGDDEVIGDLDLAADDYDGGEGMDTLDYSAALMSVVIDLVAASASGAEIGGDSITNFEVIKTGEGADEMRGGAADDVLIGNGGSDIISGERGADTLFGQAGDDVLSDGGGADVVFAGSGNDVILAAADAADDRYQGEEGFDTLDYSQAAHGVLIDLTTGTATGFDVGQDIIDGFEKVVGGAGDDTVMVSTAAVVIQGGDGADMFQFEIPNGRSGAQVMHQILDFMVGDRIEMSKYQIFEDVMETLEERFVEAFGEQEKAETLPIRIRHEGTGDLETTLIEVDMDKDEHFEMTVNLSGHHLLMIVENA
ncbi:cadherin-like domain-containing protein [Rhizobium sp. BK251]|uniref:cadherin-like domain-containing protein n=1 Tax=Rhizobium sp. BK251 TaxID=2512125 RepID=UPI0010487A84|nr:cadherin-like domain-containing protein [Rhizobium sp. BK251]TCL64654.1 Ca2+-binding RTX toxin-like protein [Rhizobium sp. BK251]